MGAQHTPTPWTLGWGGGLTGPTTPNVSGATCGGRDWSSFPISQGMETLAICPAQRSNGGQVAGSDEANAAFIVRACNAHDDLVAALKKCALVVAGEDMTKHAIVRGLEMARAALAKAEASQ